MDVQLKRVVCAMEMEDSVHRQPLIFAEIEIARDVRGTKADLWILITLQNNLLHFLISRFIPACTACGLDRDQTICSIRSRIHMDDTAVEGEGTLSGVEDSLQRPVD
jgi:hypothetical protein